MRDKLSCFSQLWRPEPQVHEMSPGDQRGPRGNEAGAWSRVMTDYFAQIRRIVVLRIANCACSKDSLFGIL
jgi:hypothetical protein